MNKTQKILPGATLTALIAAETPALANEASTTGLVIGSGKASSQGSTGTAQGHSQGVGTNNQGTPDDDV